MDVLTYLNGVVQEAAHVSQQITAETSTWPMEEKMVVGSILSFVAAYAILKAINYGRTEPIDPYEKLIEESKNWLDMTLHPHKYK